MRKPRPRTVISGKLVFSLLKFCSHHTGCLPYTRPNNSIRGVPELLIFWARKFRPEFLAAEREAASPKHTEVIRQWDWETLFQKPAPSSRKFWLHVALL